MNYVAYCMSQNSLGARIHYLCAAKGHALRVRQGGKEEGPDQEPGRSLLQPTKGK